MRLPKLRIHRLRCHSCNGPPHLNTELNLRYDEEVVWKTKEVARLPFHLSQQTLQILSMVAIVFFASSVIIVRLQAAKRPTSARKIIIPPLGMSTGFLMFALPFMRIPWTFGVIAFMVGCLFSIPLIITSRMETVDDHVYLKRSPAFILVLLALLAIRLLLHSFIEKFVTIPQTGAIFFILAFGMLLPWRVAMYVRFKAFIANTPLAVSVHPERGR